MSLRTTAIAVALAASALPGCGGRSALSQDQYTAQINAARSALVKAFDSLGPAMSNPQSGTALSAKLNAGAKALRETAAKLDAITPPAGVERANKDLAAGLDAMGDAYDRAAIAARSGTITEVLPKLQAITTSNGVDTVRKAIAAIKAKGYRISSAGG